MRYDSYRPAPTGLPCPERGRLYLHSLLWVREREAESPAPICLQTLYDLRMDEIVTLFGAAGEDALAAGDVLRLAQTKADDIALRQGVLRELAENESYAGLLRGLYASMGGMERLAALANAQREPLVRLHGLYRLHVLYTDTVAGLVDGLSGAGSAGLRALRGFALLLWETQRLAGLRERLRAIAAYWNPPDTVTFGLNVDTDYNVTGLTVTELGRGGRRLRGLPLSLPEPASERCSFAPQGKVARDRAAARTQRYLVWKLSSLLRGELARLRRDLRGLDGDVAEQLLRLKPDILFYTSGARWHGLLRGNGGRACYPSTSGGALRYRGFCCPLLSVQNGGNVVPNDIDWGGEQPVCLLTGANHAGKTTVLRALGLNQLLFRMGFAVAAVEASLPLFSRVLGLFVHGENDVDSRFALDAGRTMDILEAGAGALALFNEPYTSTNEREGTEIAAETLVKLAAMGARSVCVTHYYGLYELLRERGMAVASFVLELDRLPAAPGGRVAHRRTYRLIKAPPYAVSYARELAEKFGFTVERALSAAERNPRLCARREALLAAFEQE